MDARPHRRHPEHPPFDDAYNLRYNDAHARIFKLLAQSGIAPVERDLFEAEMAIRP